MTTFLNIDLERKTPNKFIWKHFLFSSLWILGILIVFFRVDIIFLNKSNISISWLEGTSPIVFLLLACVVIITQAWYYSLALFFYPILAFFWFIPKLVLSKGKIYLFLKYITYVFDKFKNFKKTIFHFGLFTLSIALLLIIGDVWIRWFAVAAITYFYLSFLIKYIRCAFQPTTLFGNDIEQMIDGLLKKGKQNESILITTLLIKEDKGDSDVEDVKNKNLTRLIMINYALETIVSRLNGFRGKRAYAISLMYELFIFLIFSILFFWFVNYQLFKINSLNYYITGAPTSFEFLYYSIKNIAFSGIDTIKPTLWITKIVEVFSYLVVAVLLMVIIISLVFSLRNEKINENIKLTTAVCADQNRIVQDYVLKTYGKDIESAITEVANIKKALQQLRNVINKIF